jgi:hypothetical protein
MEFGLENCVKFLREKGNLIHSQNLIFIVKREIQQLEEGKTYMYLGTEKLKAYNKKK